jgi:hypothetical protein
MAFTSNIAQRQSNTSKTYTPIKRDMLMLVTGYDLEKYTIMGTLSDGRKIEVTINAEAFARGVKSERDAPYQKHRIDKKMSEKIPANGKTYAILENAEVLRKGKNDVRIVSANRVHMAGSNKNKVIETLITFTMNHKHKKVERVQSWSPDSFLIDNVDKENIFMEQLNRFSELHRAEESKLEVKKSSFWLPYAGFELKTLKVPFNPVDQTEIIDLSGRFETTNKEEVVNEEVFQFRNQITADEYKTIKNQYESYVKATYGEDVRIEVCTYISYPVSQYLTDLDFNSVEDGKYNPFLRMATAKSKLSLNEAIEVEGGNYGCWGIIKIAPDALNQETGEVKKQYYVSSIFVNTTAKNFVHQKIKTEDLLLPIFNEGLRSTLMTYTPKQNVEHTYSQQSKPVAQTQSFSACSDDPWADDLENVLIEPKERLKYTDTSGELQKMPSSGKKLKRPVFS